MDEAAPASEATEPTEGRRQVEDRRRRPTPMVSRYLLFGRRRGGRRDGEDERTYVDRPGAWVVAAFIAVSVLSVADAWLTLDVLARGGREANPVMRAALSLGSTGFVALKTFVTVVGAAFLGLHKNWPIGRVCLWLALAGYAAVTAWHVVGRALTL